MPIKGRTHLEAGFLPPFIRGRGFVQRRLGLEEGDVFFDRQVGISDEMPAPRPGAQAYSADGCVDRLSRPKGQETQASYIQRAVTRQPATLN